MYCTVLCCAVCEFAGTRFIFRLLEYIARVLHSFYLFQFRAAETMEKCVPAYAVLVYVIHILMCALSVCVCPLVDYI